MPYILVEDFRSGLDTRRTNLTSVPGSLVTLKNAHLTRGGEIEKRKAFVEVATLPVDGYGVPTTFGLAAAGGQIYVFGSESSVSFASGTPDNLNYISLLHPTSGVAMTGVLGVDFFDGKVYVSAQYDDGRIYHYWDGQDDSSVTPPNRIADWFDGRARNKFQVTGGTAGGTSASGSITVTGGSANPGDDLRYLRVNNVDLMATSVAHTGDNSTTATAVATAVNAHTSTPNYTATASGAAITLTAADVGTTANGYAITSATDGEFSVGTPVAFSGGVYNAVTSITVDGQAIIGQPINWSGTHTATAAQIAEEINEYSTSPEFEATSVGSYVNIITKDSGTAANNDVVAVTVSGDVTTAFSPSAQNYMDGGATPSEVSGFTPGGFVRTVRTKVHSLSDSLWHFSGINDPKSWTTATYDEGTPNSTGSGYINLSNNARGSEDLKALSPYFGNVAVFAEQALQIWSVDPDPNKMQQVQVLNNTGTIAPGSVVSFGDSDVFYLGYSGIRSLRARDSSNAAYVSDIGNPIDANLIADLLNDETAVRNAAGFMSPREGRYFLAVGSKIYVFSYFPASKVSAWSVYEPGFTVEAWAYDGEQLMCRGTDNKLYSLGGAENNTYDSAEVVIQLPFLDAKSPATEKDWNGLDAVVENEWKVSIGTDPADITTYEEAAVISKATYGMGRIPLSAYSTHIALRLECSEAGAAKLGNLAVHYNGSESG